MKILYISSYVDNNYFNKIFDNAIEKPIQSIQKFNNMFCDGLVKNKEVSAIDVISSSPVNRSISKKLFWKGKKYSSRKVNFTYIPFINIKALKQLCLFFGALFIILWWCIKNIRKEKVLVFDGFYPIVSTIGTIWCSIFNVSIIGLYTDIPKCMNHNMQRENTFYRITRYMVGFGDFINRGLSDGFIFLTEKMNDIINKREKPYIVMEGMVDLNNIIKTTKAKKKAIMYAGGLYETYGIKTLVDAFVKWNNSEYELWLCGNGDLVEYIEKQKNNRIKYLGALPNSEVLLLEKKATLLINPRPTSEEFTKYSFPSKLMEYMLSKTPVLTTKLSGIPEEYDSYLYYIDDISVDGLINDFNNILVKTSSRELKKKGENAFTFVNDNKNNIKQTKRILNFIKTVKENRNDLHKKLAIVYLLFNALMLFLSVFNFYGLYSVSFRTYFLYSLSVLCTIIGMSLIKKRIPVRNKCGYDYNFLKSKWFTILLTLILVIVVWYFGKYLYIISKLPASEIRIAAYRDLYSNAYDAIFYIYILSNLASLCTILLALHVFDNSYNYSKKKIVLLLAIFIPFSLIGFGRMRFFNLILASIFALMYFYKKKPNKNSIKKYLVYGIICFIVFSGIVMYFRVFNGKDSNIISMLDYQIKQIFDYFLGSFRLLDSFITKGFASIGSMTYGRATFAAFDEILLYPAKYLGSDVLSFNQIISVVTQKGQTIGINTPYFNAFYTNVMNFYLDFGIIGVIGFSLLQGMLIKGVFNLYYRDKSIVSKLLIVIVSINLMLNIFNWQYQTGSEVFVIVTLLLVNYINRRKNESIMDC